MELRLADAGALAGAFRPDPVGLGDGAGSALVFGMRSLLVFSCDAGVEARVVNTEIWLRILECYRVFIRAQMGSVWVD